MARHHTSVDFKAIDTPKVGKEILILNYGLLGSFGK
jgi:hypothetical protein